MDDELFDRLLQKHMFGTASEVESRRLVSAALESAERALELAKVEEIRGHLSDPEFRRELIAGLPAPPPAQTAARARWFSWSLVVPVATGVAVVLGLIVLDGVRAVHDRAPAAQNARVADPSLEGQTPSSGIDIQVPARTDRLGVAGIESVFSLPETRRASIGLALPPGARHAPTDPVTVTFRLSTPGRVYALVRGPGGQFREIYPSDRQTDQKLGVGRHEIVFPASGRLDPDAGGTSTLRLCVVTDVASAAPQDAPERWAWLAANATFEEGRYAVDAR